MKVRLKRPIKHFRDMIPAGTKGHTSWSDPMLVEFDGWKGYAKVRRKDVEPLINQFKDDPEQVRYFFVNPKKVTANSYDVLGIVPLESRHFKWSAPRGKALPAVGETVEAGINSIGACKVIGYFVEHSWVGILAEPVKPPEWYVKQNGPGQLACLFGTELKW